MSVPTLNPPRDLGADYDLQETSLPPGTRTQYGTTTWIPDGYPQGYNRPYLQDDGKILIRPLSVRIPPGNAAQAPYYLLAALQAAVNSYGKQTYDVNYKFPNVASGQGDIAMSLAWGNGGGDILKTFVARRTGGGTGDVDWAVPPPNPSGWESFGALAAKYVPAATNTLLNYVVPGLGTQMSKLSGAVFDNASTGTTSATTPAQVAAGTTLENNLLAGYQSFVDQANANPIIKLGALVVLVIIIILIAI